MRVVFPKRVCVCVLAIVAGLETQNLFTIFHAIVFVLNFISFVFAVRAFFTNIVTYLVHSLSPSGQGATRALTRPSCAVCGVYRAEDEAHVSGHSSKGDEAGDVPRLVPHPLLRQIRILPPLVRLSLSLSLLTFFESYYVCMYLIDRRPTLSCAGILTSS